MYLVIGIAFSIMGFALGIGLRPYLGNMVSLLINVSLSLIGGAFIAQQFLR